MREHDHDHDEHGENDRDDEVVEVREMAAT